MYAEGLTNFVCRCFRYLGKPTGTENSALANYETTLPMHCWSSGEVTCPGNGAKVGDVYIGYSLR